MNVQLEKIPFDRLEGLLQAHPEAGVIWRSCNGTETPRNATVPVVQQISAKHCSGGHGDAILRQRTIRPEHAINTRTQFQCAYSRGLNALARVHAPPVGVGISSAVREGAATSAAACVWRRADHSASRREPSRRHRRFASSRLDVPRAFVTSDLPRMETRSEGTRRRM